MKSYLCSQQSLSELLWGHPELGIHAQCEVTGVLPVQSFFLLTAEVHLAVAVLPHLCLYAVVLRPLKPRSEKIAFSNKKKREMKQTDFSSRVKSFIILIIFLPNISSDNILFPE